MLPNPAKLDHRLIETSPLRQNQKDILIMREVEGMSNADVAKQLQKDPSTTSGQYTEARRSIDEWVRSRGPAAQLERDEGMEQAEVFKLLDKNTPLTQVTIETGLTEEKVSRHADAYIRLTEKQQEFSQKVGGGQGPEAESEAGQMLSRLKRLLAFVEKQGAFKAQNCRHAGRDRYCQFWTWPTEPAELSRFSKKDENGLFHVQTTPVMCASCHAFADRKAKTKA